ncbi:56e95d94-26c2-44b8-879f-7c4870050598 [Sclerotinia trifoliorum]|uniref:56e95d94-26c2-44b8-879f-7c4870050598 n=1 Tax=Sclerotinia trifoliorum TaxID=28548 RepID=A0A8H2W2L7_9HELO|nr:56e95d94-26c2-44b8-879f-7c4870050598 [Sclerotinia trifoliorum]
MPSRLNAPVLTVDAKLIHKVDTRNVENLYSMWTVFSRCAGSLEEGRRLENLSWRLWTRETFCCEPTSEANATTPAISISSRSSEGQYSNDVPELSGSLDSVVDEEAIEFEESTDASPLDISHPQIRRQDSCNSRSRGRERHITPNDLEKMVITIKEKKDLAPLTITTPFLAPLAERIPQFTQPQYESSATVAESSSANSSAQSATTQSSIAISEKGATSVVKGFSLSPAHVSSSMRSMPLNTVPSSIPTADIVAADTSKALAPKKKQMFALGGSSGEDSLSEQAVSMDNKPLTLQKKKPAKFSFGGSSNEDESSLPNRMQPRSSITDKLQKPLAKKQTSFQEEVATRTIQEEVFDDDVFETDDEDDVDESAIDDDDDSSDWEDSVEDSGNASIDDKTFFQRVDSRPQLTSRRSLITTMLHQNDRAQALATEASRSTPALRRSRNSSPNGPSLAASPESDEAPLMMRGLKSIAEVPRGAQPIIKTTTNTTAHHQALSPRTTRRNMLATELTVSLRQNLLWERRQKSSVNEAAAALKRRHTAHDVKNLKQYPEKVYMDKDDQALNSSWNQYFSQGLGEYHSKGW